jgi:hypothetical protein
LGTPARDGSARKMINMTVVNFMGIPFLTVATMPLQP